MGRPGETQEVANAIVFLASKEASYYYWRRNQY